MGFLTGILKAAAGVAVTPIAVAKDIVDVAQGYTPETTVNVISNTIDTTVDAVEDLTEGDLL